MQKKANNKKSKLFLILIAILIIILIAAIATVMLTYVFGSTGNNSSAIIESSSASINQNITDATSNESNSAVALGGPGVGTWQAKSVVIAGISMPIDAVAQTGLVENFNGDVSVIVDTFGTFTINYDGNEITGTWNYTDNTNTAINYTAQEYSGIGELDLDNLKLIDVMDLGVDMIMERVE